MSSFFTKHLLHRPGIEPGPPAWQASILPLNQRCFLTSVDKSKIFTNVRKAKEKKANYLHIFLQFVACTTTSISIIQISIKLQYSILWLADKTYIRQYQIKPNSTWKEQGFGVSLQNLNSIWIKKGHFCFIFGGDQRRYSATGNPFRFRTMVVSDGISDQLAMQNQNLISSDVSRVSFCKSASCSQISSDTAIFKSKCVPSC